MCTLTISLLGPFRALLDDQPLAHFRSSRTQALLIYLLDTRPVTHQRESLMALFWEDMPTRSAQINLRQTLYQLNKLIPLVASQQASQPVPLLLADRQQVWLNQEAAIVLDTELVAASLESAASPTIAQLEAAARRFRGEFVADFHVADCAPFAEWLLVRQAYYRRQHLLLLEKLTRLYLASGAYREAAGIARRQLQIDPWHSVAHHLLIEAMALGGRRNEALAHYDAYCRLMAEELGLQPGSTTLALRTRLVAGRFEPRPLTQLQGYTLAERLGRSDTAEVYRARQHSPPREVAIKIIRPVLAERAGFAQRFLAEARLIARLEHPHIVPLYDYWQDQSGAYLVMRFMAGGTLAQRLARSGPLEMAEALDICAQIGAALAAIHQANVLHRDVKPENILLDERGYAYLGDFGIAREMGQRDAAVDLVLGTPAYIAPEQMRGDSLTPQCDIYSLGIVLYEMLTGARPFPDVPLADRLTNDVPRLLPSIRKQKPEVAAALDPVLRQATAANLSERFGSINDFLAALDVVRETAMLPPASTPTAPEPLTNLPPPPAGFVGRDQELAELAALLSDQKQRLVTIVGPGGMGKTRLALELGQQLLSESPFNDGIFLVNLAPVQEADRLAGRIVEALGLHLEEDSNRPLIGQLLAYFRHKQLLLILDNFEHLLPHTALVQQLLQEAPGLSLLVTSRERLQLHQEQLFPIDGFAVPHHVGPGEVGLGPACRLFQQRARQLRPDFTLTVAADRAQVAEICQLVGGLPLAIELAAGWVDVLSLTEIAAEIGKGLDILETGIQDVSDRHRSIRATIMQSWSKLSEAERMIFCALSLFQGGFTREAARAVAGASIRELARLHGKSLLSFDQQQQRYAIHGLLQQFGLEMLGGDPARAQAVRDRHSVFYGDFCATQGERMKGGAQLLTLRRIQLELDNCRAAWQWALAQRQYEQLLQAVFIWYDVMGNWLALYQELNSLFGQLAEVARADDSRPAQQLLFLVWVLQGHLATRGDLDALSNRPEAVRARAAQAVALLGASPIRQLDDWSDKYFGQTLLSGQLDDLARGISLCQQSVAAFTRLDDSYHKAHSLWSLSVLQDLQGHSEARQVSLEAALQAAQQAGNEALIIDITIQLAYLAQDQSRLDEALALANRALELSRRLERPHHIASCQRLLGWNHLISGRFAQAYATYEASIQYYETYGYDSSLRTAHYDLGHTAFHMGDYALVRRLLEQVLANAEADADEFIAAIARCILGNALLLLGDPAGAIDLHEKSLASLRPLGPSLWWLPQFLTYQAIGYVHGGRLDRAEQVMGEALRWTADDPRWHTGIVLAGAALVLAARGERVRAVAVYAAACSHPHVGQSSYYADAVGKQIDAVAASLDSEELRAAQASGAITELGALVDMVEQLAAEMM